MSHLLSDQNAAKWLAFLFFLIIGILLITVLRLSVWPIIRKKLFNKKYSSDFSEKRRSYGKNMRRFWIVWLFVFAILLTVFIIGTVILNTLLYEYECAQPSHEAERIFNEYFADIDIEKIRPFISYKETEFESSDSAVETVNNAIKQNGTQTSYHEVISDDGNVHKYAVTVGEYTLGYFTVCKDEGNTTPKYHFSYCKCGNITVNAKPINAIVIFAPMRANVYVNGTLLTEKYREGDPILFEKADYFPESDDSWRSMVNYVVKNLYNQPQITVTYPGNVQFAIIEDEATGKYHIEPCDPGNEPTSLSLVYDKEQNSYSAESSYIRMLANAYNTAIDTESNKRYAEYLKTETEIQLLSEKTEYDLLCKREEERIQAAIDFEISESIRTQYESRVKLLTEKYAYFIYQSPTSSYRTATLPYTEKNSVLYKYVKSEYTNYSYYYPSKITFTDFSSSNYRWTDDTHKSFTCDVSIKIEMYGQRNNKYYSVTETFSARLTVSFKTSNKGLLTNSENIA